MEMQLRGTISKTGVVRTVEGSLEFRSLACTRADDQKIRGAALTSQVAGSARGFCGVVFRTAVLCLCPFFCAGRLLLGLGESLKMAEVSTGGWMCELPGDGGLHAA